MQKTSQPVVSERAPLIARWRRIRRVYQAANLATHHVLGFALKAGVLAYFLFALILLVLRYAILPNIDHYKSDIEQLASKAVGNQVSIARIYASWHGLRPNLFLGDVSLRDSSGHAVLSLPSVSATLSWWSVLSGTVNFDALEVTRPELTVRRDASGKLYAAGILIDPSVPSDGKGADWLLSQREIVIRQGRLLWSDDLRKAPPLRFENVNLVLRNHWRQHQLGVQATPPAALAAPLDVRADFYHPHFARHISDLKLWQGELFVAVRQADLAAWKSYLDYPFELNAGHGSLRAWLTLDHTRLAGFTADIGLADVRARLAPDLAPLELAQVQGRLTASAEALLPSNEGKAGFGTQGHAVSVSNFSLLTPDGLSLPPTSLSERYVAPLHGQPGRVKLQAAQLDLHTLAVLAGRLPLSLAQREMLDALAPRGSVQDFSAEWQGALPAPDSFHVKGRLLGLGLNPQPARVEQAASDGAPAQTAQAAWPGVDNLSGTLDVTQHGGSVSLDAPQLLLQWPSFLAAPLPFEQLKLKASWAIDSHAQLTVQLADFDFLQQGLSGALHGSYASDPGHGPGTLDLTGSFNHVDVTTIGRYLPQDTAPDLRAWLSGALEKGSAQDVSLRLRGDLAQFPFKGEGAASRGEFRVAGRIVDGTLNYAPGHFAADGKAPMWPQAEHIKGSFLFQHARMEIRADSASTGGVSLTAVKAVIPDLTAPDQVLQIDGAAYGPMQQYLAYMAASPVLGWIGDFTDQSTATGNARLALNLHLPLARLGETKVHGALALMSNDVVLFDDLPPLQAAQGRIEFNEKGVNLAGVNGIFLGGPLTLSGGTLRDNSIQVKLAGSVTADGLKKNYPTPVMQRLATYFDGGARFTGSVTQRANQLQVQLESNLAGVGLSFPAPLKKTAQETLPLKFLLTGGGASEAGVTRDEIQVALGSNILARYERAKQGQQAWRVVRGGIGVNRPAPQPDNGLMLNVSLQALNVDAWTDLTSVVAAASGPPPALTAAADSAGGIAQYVVPDTMAAHADQMLYGGRKLERVVIGVSHQDQLWQANIDSTQVAGHVAWNQTASGLGKVTARLSSLIIPASAAGEVQTMLEDQSGAMQTMPSLDIVAERFELFNKQLGRLELQAYNARTAAGREWRVKTLSLTNPDGELKGSGKWMLRDGRSNTSLNFELNIADAGKLLDRFGFADTVRNGKGKLSGDIEWQGLPYALDWPSLSGQVQMNVESGQFLKQDPGAAKLLGVLSLQALPRLLKLDFHDVFSEGLAFDGISATAAIQHGVVQTDNLKMHGVAATVLMDGSADLANESSNLHVVVIPEFNLGTGPLVYALAVNPVIGIGSFLAQLFLRAPVMKALTYQMQVTGPWKLPVITKLASSKLPAAPVKIN